MLAFAPMKKLLLVRSRAVRSPSLASRRLRPRPPRSGLREVRRRLLRRPLRGEADPREPRRASTSTTRRCRTCRARRSRRESRELQGAARTTLTALDRAKLSFDDAIDAEAIEGEIRSELLDLETLRRPGRTTRCATRRTAGFAVNDLMKRDFAPTSRAARVRSRRGSAAVPAICAAGKANVKNPPKEFTTLAMRMSKGAAGFLAGHGDRLGQGRRGLRRGAAAGLRRTPTERPIAAVQDFAAWLEKDLAPRSNGTYAIGAENFSAKLRYDEMVDWPLSRGARDGRGEPREGLRGLRRDGEEDRPLEDARRGHEVALERASDGRRPDPVRRDGASRRRGSSSSTRRS